MSSPDRRNTKTMTPSELRELNEARQTAADGLRELFVAEKKGKAMLVLNRVKEIGRKEKERIELVGVRVCLC